MKPAITIAAIIVGLAVVFAVTFYGPGRNENPQSEGDQAKLAEPGDESSDSDSDGNGEDADDTENTTTPEIDPSDVTDPDDDPAVAEFVDPDAQAPEVEGGNVISPDTYRPVFANDLTHTTIGNADPESDFELSVEIDPYRAGVHAVELTQFSAEVDGDDRYPVLGPIDLHIEGAPTIGSYAARSVTINGQEITLYELDEQTQQWRGAWTVTDRNANSVTLSLLIQGGSEDEPVDIARINRTYSVTAESFTLQLEQDVTNLTDEEMTITWAQLGQGDIEYTPDYLKGRSQYFVLGYFDNDHDPGHFTIRSDDGYIARNDVISRTLKEKDNAGVWPRNDIDEQAELAWLASTNRFFAIVTSTHIDPESDSENSEAIASLMSVYPNISTSVYPSKKNDPDLSPTERSVLLTLYSREITLSPGKTSAPEALGLDIFIGPRDKDVFSQTPYKSMRLGNLIRYSLGGMCGFCTFAWLADGLLAMLNFFHMLTRDWGIAIILLVLIVRLCLHPLTKRGQISMMKMSKQMSKVAPDVAKLKKKYVDNPQKFQQEQMKLYREKGINPAASAMGCLPMFFQMPIWIALYAMLYFVIELRHQDAFYGLFQLVSAGHWHFLADLSRSDQFIRFSAEPKLISLWLITFDYSHINILPLLMGFTFYFNMKLTTPPPTTDQQAQQQKIMKFMPFLFPVMLYSAPSALTLYICASTFAGMVDSYIVRKHIKDLEESGDLFKPKERKEGGFLDRMSKAVESAQSQRADQAKQQGKGQGPQHKKRKKK